MLLDPTKHRNIRYAFDSHNVSRQVNQPTFRHFNKLESDFFEVEHSKKETVFGMSIQSGFFILQYTKLRMLNFYYKCVDQYLDKKIISTVLWIPIVRIFHCPMIHFNL